MVDDVLGPTLANSHLHRIQHQFGAQVVCHRPADDLAAPGVEHDGEIEKPRHCRHISDVGDPQLVRSGSVEVAVDQVGREVPADKAVHVVLDNYATHKHPK